MFSKRSLKNIRPYDNIDSIENHSQNRKEKMMPTEVLTYFLKNSDRRIRLMFQVVLQCAPFLKGLKVSCGITMNADLYEGLGELFSGMDISYYKLSETDGRCLVLFYRPSELKAYLCRRDICALIREYGYQDMETEEMLERLAERVRACAELGLGFPHEIGAFFGYPAEDVRGFIENGGREYVMTGYWKVYSDPAGARMVFKEFDRAKNCAVNEFLTGKSIREIAL